MKLRKLFLCSVAALTLCATSSVFANDLAPASMEAYSNEVAYTLVETEIEGEYILQPVIGDSRSISTGEVTKTLSSGADTYYTFDNDALIGTHKKCKVTIIKNPGLDIKATLINRDSGETVDSTYFYGGTGSYTFNLDSGLADYKIYIGNKSNTSGQIKFSIKSS